MTGFSQLNVDFGRKPSPAARLQQGAEPARQSCFLVTVLA
jgi:hypothetical protein